LGGNYTNPSMYSNLGHGNNYEMMLNSPLPNNNINNNYGFNGNSFNNVNNISYMNNNNNINNNYYNFPQTSNSMPTKIGMNISVFNQVPEFNPNINDMPQNNFPSLNMNGYGQHKNSMSSVNSMNLTVEKEPAKRKSSAKTNEGKKEKEKSMNEKYTCKFEIQIENDNEFQVCRKIIGSKGCNMKNIVDTCKINTMLNVNEPVKLRLRGKGSGYKEGPDHKESDESLHLCVSSKYQELYYLACRLVEDLMLNLYDEYRKFCEKKGGNYLISSRLMIKKTEGDHTSVNYNMTKSFQNKAK